MVDGGQKRERMKSFLRIVRAARCYVAVGFSRFRTLIGMLLFGIADAALFSFIQVYLLTDNTDNAKAFKYSNWYRYIHMCYITVYCAVFLEILACAIFIFEKSRPLTSQVNVSKGISGWIMLISSRLKSQISQCLVFFIMPFSCYSLSYQRCIYRRLRLPCRQGTKVHWCHYRRARSDSICCRLCYTCGNWIRKGLVVEKKCSTWD
jgi:hypothetical protein